LIESHKFHIIWLFVVNSWSLKLSDVIGLSPSMQSWEIGIVWWSLKL